MPDDVVEKLRRQKARIERRIADDFARMMGDAEAQRLRREIRELGETPDA